MTDYSTDSGTVYSINSNSGLITNVLFPSSSVQITDPNGDTVYSNDSLPNTSILFPGASSYFNILSSGDYIVAPGATGNMTLASGVTSTIWVGGAINYSALVATATNTTFNVDGGSLKATVGELGSTATKMTVNLTNGGVFSEALSTSSLLSSTTINFGTGGGTYIANTGGAIINLTSQKINGFNSARDYIQFINMPSDPVSYKITNKNAGGILGIGDTSSQTIDIFDASGNKIASVTVTGINFPAGSYKVGANGPLTVSDSGSTITVEATPVTCFLEGSMIQTADGDKAVEDIRVGDELVTFDWRENQQVMRPVVWAGKAHCRVTPELTDDKAGYPVRILKDAFAEGVPFKDMLITAEHCLFFDGKFVPVRMLVNGRSVFYDKSITSYDYYHIETKNHAVIIADGMLSESYLDTGNRHAFDQYDDNSMSTLTRRLTWDESAAAPLDVSREFVEPLFRQIETRAEHIQCAAKSVAPTLTDDMDLHLITDTGLLLRQRRERNGRVIFSIPAGVKSVRLVSNASRPSDVIGPFVDDRRYFGVSVGEIVVFKGDQVRAITAHLTEKTLEGWGDSGEEGTRWTTGNAVLPLGEHSFRNIGLLAVQIKAAGPYVLKKTEHENVAMIA
ncbi:hypothetical protein GS501_06095 [Saccharibacter sp. 17.LH.SD]|uniref:Hint domain-containing protein n=1 Tax=Saccharibacter sp. 17.LH.SD TaxID=2689393 RepID=UPI00136DCECB|nr:Hint domain-containing protein [Saccharibacter sp. 17.LH.SD]MXV44616.1 hypothetical protein [Saccharibacter sp. 17.LH.SD]